MRTTLIGILFALLVSCNTGTMNNDKGPTKRTDTVTSFTVIKKDSAHVVDYRFAKKSNSDKGFSFNYSDEADSFILFLDTSKGVYSGKFGTGAIVNFDLEKANYYIINGSSFKVLKLIGDKGVMDGEFSIFLSPDFGLLVSKSNTWRTAKVICPVKSDSNYVQLSALLYRVQTDGDFFTSPVPALNKKITPPKFE